MLPACEHFAGSEKLIRKALEIQRAKARPFDVTLDLEDGAPEGRAREHAALFVELLRSEVRPLVPGARRAAGVGARIHPPHHPEWRADVEALVQGAGDRLAYLTVPKATSAAEVDAVIEHVRAAESRAGLPRRLPIHVLIETHGALRDVWAIAALPGVEVLDFGLMDFISGHHGAILEDCMRSPGQFDHALVRRAKAEIAAAALAHGAVPAHNVTIDFRDDAAARRDAARAHRELGFLRMWSIHPSQIDPITEAMAPDFSDVEQASAILLAARDRDWAPIAIDGRLYDRASYRYHWILLQRAALAGAPLEERVRSAFFAG